MKNTGINRRLDDLGRITLPIELRRSLDIDQRDPIEIFTDGDKIILKKATYGDIFTGDESDIMYEYLGKKVSRESVEALAKLAGLI